MSKITATDELINIPVPLKSFGKPFATYDETLLYKKNKVRINQNITITRPKVLYNDPVAPYNSATKLLNAKIAIDNQKPFLGILTASAIIGDEVELIKKGIVDDPALTGGVLNQEVYVNPLGELTFDVVGLKVGRVINISPKKVFINLTRLFDELNEPIFLSNPGKNLYYTLRFLSYYLPMERFSLFSLGNTYDFRTNHVGFGKTSFVALSPGTTQKAYASEDLGKTWSVYNLPENNVWEGSAYNQGEFSSGVFIAVASSGSFRILVSNDLKYFKKLAPPQLNNFKSVVYADNKFIAVAESGASRVLKIVNGVTPWSDFAFDELVTSAKAIVSIATVGAKRVAVAESGTNRVLFSADGITWGEYPSSNEFIPWRSVCGYPLKFVAAGDNAMMYSADGMSWTSKVTGPFLAWKRIITCSTSSFFAISTNYFLFMDYNLVSVNQGVPPGDGWVDVAEGGTNHLVAVSNSGAFDKVMRSTDYGASWTLISEPTNSFFNSIAWGNNLFVAVNSNPIDNVIYSSDLGLTWNIAVTPQGCSKICFSYTGSIFFAISASSAEIYYSADAITWTTLVGTGFYSDIVGADNNKTLAIRNGVANISQIDNAAVPVQINNLTMTTHAASEPNSWKSVTYGLGKFVAVSSDGTNRVMVSPDGTTWSARPAAEANSWKSVTFGNGKFVAVSSDGTNRVMVSTDGDVWTAHLSTEQNSWESVAFGNDLFYAISSDGTNRAMKSKDGITWEALSILPETWKSIKYGLGVFIAGHSNLSTAPSISRTAFI